MTDWIELDDGFRRRNYDEYSEYLRIQAEKLDRRPGFAAEYSKGLRGGLGKRLVPLISMLPEKGNVLCLGARVGGEVQAFIDAGFFAVGIDINPGAKNQYVLYGDFHDIAFPDQSVDIVYTNSLDHVLELDKLLSEVKRVLKPEGIFLTESKGGVAEPEVRSARSDAYDCLEWPTLEMLIERIASSGFTVIHCYRFRGFTPNGVLFQKCD